MNNRSKLLLGVTAAAAGIAAAALVDSETERDSLEPVLYELNSPKIKGPERTLVFLSDLHAREFGAGNRRLLNAVRSLHPDAVLFGGDMVTAKRTGGAARTEEAVWLAAALSLRYPVYCAEGNHEERMDREREKFGDRYDRYRETLEKAGVRWLKDSSAELGSDLRITGLTTEERYYRKFTPARMDASYIEDRVGKAAEDRFQILLAHSPEFPEAYAAWGADLSLCGHYHGGTIRLPGDIGLMTPQYAFFRTNVTGLHRTGDRVMIVSAGLGTHSINIRINNRPQVIAVRLRGAEGSGCGRI